MFLRCQSQQLHPQERPGGQIEGLSCFVFGQATGLCFCGLRRKTRKVCQGQRERDRFQWSDELHRLAVMHSKGSTQRLMPLNQLSECLLDRIDAYSSTQLQSSRKVVARTAWL